MVSVREPVREHLGRLTHRTGEALGDELLLMDLVAESFVLIEVVIELQERFAVRLVQPDLQGVVTVGDLLTVFEKKLQSPQNS